MILHHLTGRGQDLEAALAPLPAPFRAVVHSGYLAVATFFVLSGFVLARTYTQGNWTARGLWRYGVARFSRVYPVYALSLAVMTPFIAADRTPAKGPLLAAHGFLLQGWLGRLPVNWNTPAWSLSCEIFFYLSFPLAAAALTRAGWPRTLAVAGLACCLTRVLWAAGLPDSVKPLVHFSDFLMGIAASRIFDLLRARPRPPAGRWLYLPAAALGATLIAWPGVLPSAIDLNTALRPLNALLLIGLSLGGGAAARALSTRGAVYLGKASYAMYILHVPLLWWYLRMGRGFSPALYIAAVIAVSAAVYRLIEEPANRYLRSRLEVSF